MYEPSLSTSIPDDENDLNRKFRIQMSADSSIYWMVVPWNAN